MRRAHITAAAVLMVAGLTATAPVVSAAPSTPESIDTSALTKAVTVNGQLTTLRQLQVIATRNQGTRSSGLPGYTQSSAYIESELKKSGYTVTKQTFTFPFSRTLEPPKVTQVTPTSKEFTTAALTFSGSGDVTGPITPIDVTIPPGPAANSSTSGCEASDFPAAGSPNAVALIQRGTCPFATKAANAKAAGYGAALIFNEGQDGRVDVVEGTLGGEQGIPVLGLSFADGSALAGTPGATVRVSYKAETDPARETSNLLAELPGTTKHPDQVVVVGGHLDSVTEGPGINDNGTGSAAVLEIAKQYKKTKLYTKAQRPVRFAFWGAEEWGLLGSQHYVDSLSDDERGRIYANLNFDMIGSPNPVSFVYDGNGSDGQAGPAGSAQIEKVFLDYFGTKFLPTAPTDFDGRSDYGPFIEYGIPAGGLFSGAEGIKTAEEAARFGGTAGQPYDKCYHQACDNTTNLDTSSIDRLGDAAAHSVGVLALSKQGLYGDAQRSVRATSRSGVWKADRGLVTR